MLGHEASFEPGEAAPPDIAARMAQRLQLWTGARWGVSVVGSGGAATIAQVRAERKGDLRARALAHPMVQSVLAAFPGAEIRDVRPADALDAPPMPQAVEDDTIEDDWDTFDPFDEENDMLKGLGNLGDMAKIMKQAQEMQARMTDAQERLARSR